MTTVGDQRQETMWLEDECVALSPRRLVGPSRRRGIARSSTRIECDIISEVWRSWKAWNFEGCFSQSVNHSFILTMRTYSLCFECVCLYCVSELMLGSTMFLNIRGLIMFLIKRLPLLWFWIYVRLYYVFNKRLPLLCFQINVLNKYLPLFCFWTTVYTHNHNREVTRA